MSAAPPPDVERLAKFLGLLGSEHAGERANAATLADRHLRSLGLDWNGLVQRAFAAPQAEQARQDEKARRGAKAAHADRTAHLIGLWELLSEWERGFVQSLHDQSRALSDKQTTKLSEVEQRVGKRARSTHGRGGSAP